jgi:hypothetical protein
MFPGEMTTPQPIAARLQRKILRIMTFCMVQRYGFWAFEKKIELFLKYLRKNLHSNV